MVTIRRWVFFLLHHWDIQWEKTCFGVLWKGENVAPVFRERERERARDERLFVKDSERVRDERLFVKDRECDRLLVKDSERERDRHVTYETLVAVIVRADGTPGKICFPQDTLPARWWITTSWCINTTNHSTTSSPTGAKAAMNQLINVSSSWPSLESNLFSNAKQIHTRISSRFILRNNHSVLCMQCRDVYF